MKILTVNPGSTSTKIGLFEDEKLLFDETIRHTTEEIAQFATISDQEEFRKELIVSTLNRNGVQIGDLDVVVGRGGLVKPITGGTYPTNEALLRDLKAGVQGQHASNLGGILARKIAKEAGNIPSFIVDPVVVDELDPIARISGHPECPRGSVFHALNTKAIGNRYALDIGKKYEDLNLIIAHLGGGVTVGVHKHGRVVDVYNAIDGDGAFSPERAGGLPIVGTLKMCYSGKYPTYEDAYKAVIGKGGVVAYLGTADMKEVEDRVEAGDEEAKKILDAFIYQVAKDIGSLATVVEGKVDQILVTGGVAYSKYVIEELKKRVAFISSVTAYPGEDELLALAQGALRVIRGEEEAKEYK